MLSIWTVLYTNELMTVNISMMITMATWVLWGSSMSTWENAQRSWSQSTIESKTRWSWQRRIWGRSDDDTWWKSIFWWFIGAKKYTSSDTTYLFQCKELEENLTTYRPVINTVGIVSPITSGGRLGFAFWEWWRRCRQARRSSTSWTSRSKMP